MDPKVISFVCEAIILVSLFKEIALFYTRESFAIKICYHGIIIMDFERLYLRPSLQAFVDYSRLARCGFAYR